MTKLEFLKSMKKLTSYFLKDMTEDQLTAWYEMFQDVSYVSLDKAIDNLVKTNKFFPTISEILENCEQQEESINYDILKLMKEDGYFKYGVMGELPIEQQSRNYDKALMWVGHKTIPEWLARDMESYRKTKLQLENKNKKSIENKNLLLSA